MNAKIVDCKHNNRSWEDRYDAMGRIATVVFDKEASKNSTKLFNRLSLEARGNAEDIPAASRSLEYIPVIVKVVMRDNTVVLSDFTVRQFKGLFNPDRPATEYETLGHTKTMSMDDFINNIMPFSFKDGDLLYTNYRALFNANIDKEWIPFTNESNAHLYENFTAMKLKTPMFVWAQFVTHTKMSKLSQSDRLVERYDYWLPKDLRQRLHTWLDPQLNDDGDINAIHMTDITLTNIAVQLLNETSIDGMIKILLEGTGSFKLSQVEVRTLFKLLGYKKEIYSRAMYYFKFKTFMMGGWRLDPKTWSHLTFERSAGWTQPESKEMCQIVKDALPA